jgi:hypothetical protein
MRWRTAAARWAVRASGAAMTAVLATPGLAAAGLAGAAGASVPGRAGTAAAAGRAAAGRNPYSPAVGHRYRHGVLPTRARARLMRRWATAHPAAAAAGSPDNLSFGGGFHGVGVTTGKEKVYLVFWGKQWGTKGTNSHGDVTLSGDPSGEAPYLRELFKGLGRGGETWSGVMTQYCQGVPYNAKSCPLNSWHVGYPSGGPLAGVWVDERKAEPANATGHQLGSEAIAAAEHFGNTTAAANRNAQYAIISPTGTHPDGFNTPSGQFCAWHDDTADPNLPAGPVSSKLDVAFTNMPYVTDLGAACGENFVNGGTAGVLDGASIVLGHEYAETITDQYPAFGWTNNSSGAEDGDLCAWNTPGTPGGTNNLKLPTGTFAMQSTWGNDLPLSAGGGPGGCEFGHRTVLNNWVLNPGFETGTFAHWTTTGATSITTTGAQSGSHAARAGKPTATSGDSVVAQTFVARGSHLSFWYDQTCPDSVITSWVTATVTDTATHTVTTVLARTCQAHSGWTKVAATLIAGHSYTLRLVSHDDGDGADGSYTLFDTVADS